MEASFCPGGHAETPRTYPTLPSPSLDVVIKKVKGNKLRTLSPDMSEGTNVNWKSHPIPEFEQKSNLYLEDH